MEELKQRLALSNLMSAMYCDHLTQDQKDRALTEYLGLSHDARKAFPNPEFQVMGARVVPVRATRPTSDILEELEPSTTY